MKIKHMIISYFIAGCIFYAGIANFAQSIMIKENWIEWYISIPISIIMLLCSGIYMLRTLINLGKVEEIEKVKYNLSEMIKEKDKWN